MYLITDEVGTCGSQLIQIETNYKINMLFHKKKNTFK